MFDVRPIGKINCSVSIKHETPIPISDTRSSFFNTKYIKKPNGINNTIFMMMLLKIASLVA